jgi:hypothetical protein
VESNVEELALAPAQPFHFRYIINPVYNLNSVSHVCMAGRVHFLFDVFIILYLFGGFPFF